MSARFEAKVFRDPVHNLIAFVGAEGAELLKLVATPELQRLRRIRQTGLSALTYPGAEHSRFTHSLGTYHVAKEMLDSIEERQALFGDLAKPLNEHRAEILVASLLHDMGHSALSHVLEQVVRPQNPPAGYPLDHEGWTRRIVRDRMANVCSDGWVDWSYVDSLFGKGADGDAVAKDIISSQLDADRLDYLLRDARAAGVPYGQYDLEWLIHSIRIGQVQVKGVEGSMPRLCFSTPKARAIVEQFIQARQCMYTQVYMHKTTRSYQAVIRHTMELARYLLDSDRDLPAPTPDALVKVVRGEPLSLDEYLDLDDFVLWSTLRVWARAEASSDGAVRLLGRKAATLVERRKPYRAVELRDDKMRATAVEVVTELKVKNSMGRFSCHRDSYEDMPYRNVFYARGEPGEELLVRPIYLLDSAGVTHLAEEDSPVIRALSDVPMRVYRLYYDGDDGEVAKLLSERKLI